MRIESFRSRHRRLGALGLPGFGFFARVLRTCRQKRCGQSERQQPATEEGNPHEKRPHKLEALGKLKTEQPGQLRIITE